MTFFRKESLEHKRRKLHGEVILVQPIGFFVMTALFFTVTAALVFFLMNGEYKRKETVIGYINPSNGLSVIRADQGGRLTQVFVNEGDFIQAGAPLFESRIDVDTQEGFVGERRLESTDVRLSELREQEAAIQDRYRQDGARFRDQINNIEREITGLKKRRGLQQQAVDLAESQLLKFERLLKDDTVSQLEFNQTKTNDINQRLSLEAIDQQIVSREGSLVEARYTLRGLGNAEERELSQLRQQIAQLEESRTSLEASSRYIVRSPISGRISALQGSVGQSVQPSAPIVMIIPDASEMIATLLAPTRAAAFLAEGQDVNLLIDAFPYQKFGVQLGVISEISQTPFRPGELNAPIAFEQSVYRIKVALDKQTVTAYGKEVELKPGMTLQGDLITDSRTLLEWMLDPLFTLKRG
ncbi:HlyD family secretion protein [Litorimonas haliclonae]|uniref:HlyD family secretion protein n=1 Tax=Litorimonas haliclonae TaxID=2081977 RepID=UPI0039F07663